MKNKTDYNLLSPVPKSLGWKIKLAIFSVFWFFSTSKKKKKWDQFYYGLIKHKCEYDYTKLKGDKYKHYSCKHYGCNIVTIIDEKDNWV